MRRYFELVDPAWARCNKTNVEQLCFIIEPEEQVQTQDPRTRRVKGTR